MSSRVGGFGQENGIGERLAYWANQLSRNKAYPWVGTGLIDDLKCAAKLQGIDFDKMFPLEVALEPERIPDPDFSDEEDEFAHWQEAPEYDL